MSTYQGWSWRYSESSNVHWLYSTPLYTNGNTHGTFAKNPLRTEEKMSILTHSLWKHSLTSLSYRLS